MNEPRRQDGWSPPESEAAALGAALVNEQAADAVANRLNADNFADPRHRLICKKIIALRSRGEPVDAATVADALGDDLGRAGGRGYVSFDLPAAPPVLGNFEHYITQVAKAAVGRALTNGLPPTEAIERLRGIGGSGSNEPVDALAAARVDLVARVREGIPERCYVPGCEPWLIAGKRYLIAAPAGAGKSLVTLVIADDVVEAGGTVAIFDVENGADEYARRQADILDARGRMDSGSARGCVERLRYFEFPALSVNWRAEDWAQALAGVDLAIFDSSRLVLSSAGLAEDSNDDYATFVNALLVPLARAGTATIVLDNMGHAETARARGASAKADLNEVVYVVKVGEQFDRDQHGHARLIRKRTRFSGLPGELHVPLGGGTYGPAAEAEPSSDSEGFRPTGQMERASKVIEERPGLSRNDVLTSIGGRREYANLALTVLVDEGFVRCKRDGKAQLHYSTRAYREVDDER